MEKVKGIHMYVNIKNIEAIIKEEEKNDDDLKRTLHRLQTYFVGHTRMVKKYGAKIEKYTGGRSHIVLQNDENEIQSDKLLKIAVASFIYNNKIFNKLSKYSLYPKFNIHAGIDFGEYYNYEIQDDINLVENTSIGRVANNSAKIQTQAPTNFIYVTQTFIDTLSREMKENFSELGETEKEDFNGKIRSKKIYKARYSNIFDEESMNQIEQELDEIKEKVEDEANSLNIKDIVFENVTKKLSFKHLSLKGTNKRLEGGVLCADIRGFTKLFHNNDQNLDDLFEVMEEIYFIMGSVINDYDGTVVQYQGDRILAVFNDCNGQSDNSIMRMLETAFMLNSKIQNLNDNYIIQQKLNNKKISIGTGCSFGKVIATRLGLNANKDNLILSESYKKANTSEDKYADSDEIVIWKTIKEFIDDTVNESETPKYLALEESFESINKTGFYKTDMTIEEFEEMVNQKKDLEDTIQSAFSANFLRDGDGDAKKVQIKPWGQII